MSVEQFIIGNDSENR